MQVLGISTRMLLGGHHSAYRGRQRLEVRRKAYEGSVSHGKSGGLDVLTRSSQGFSLPVPPAALSQGGLMLPTRVQNAGDPSLPGSG